MTAFDIDVSSPFPAGFTGGLGGPNQGGHQPPDWYIQFGMDLGADEGTEVHAAFDAHITKFSPHDPAADSGKVYGAQLFMRAPNDMMGGFYTHITDVPDDLAVGSSVSRGDLLGTVLAFGGSTAHAPCPGRDHRRPAGRPVPGCGPLPVLPRLGRFRHGKRRHLQPGRLAACSQRVRPADDQIGGGDHG